MGPRSAPTIHQLLCSPWRFLGFTPSLGGENHSHSFKRNKSNKNRHGEVSDLSQRHKSSDKPPQNTSRGVAYVFSVSGSGGGRQHTESRVPRQRAARVCGCAHTWPHGRRESPALSKARLVHCTATPSLVCFAPRPSFLSKHTASSTGCSYYLAFLSFGREIKNPEIYLLFGAKQQDQGIRFKVQTYLLHALWTPSFQIPRHSTDRRPAPSEPPWSSLCRRRL